MVAHYQHAVIVSYDAGLNLKVGLVRTVLSFSLTLACDQCDSRIISRSAILCKISISMSFICYMPSC